MPKDKPLELVRIPLSQIKPDPKNAKDHDVGLIIESFRRFGYVSPMVLNSDDFLLAGHGRRKALLAMQGDKETPPRNIEAKDDEWIVPVGVGPDFDQREGTAYRLVDNRSTELGGYDEPQLLENLIALSKNGGLDATGYDLEDVDRLFQLLNPNLEEVAVSDEAEKLQRKWKTKSGQLWEIGRHRLLCGDATSVEDVERLLDGKKAACIFTDPPYNVASESRNFAADRSAAMRELKNAEWDKNFDIASIFPGLEQAMGNDCAVYVCTSHWLVPTIWKWMRKWSDFYSYIVWCKSNPMPALSKRHWTWATELIAYAVRGKHQANFPIDGHALNWWEIPKNKETSHPTEKPVGIPRRAIGFSSKRSDVIFDPFIGSGTTMVAAEQLNRICYGMEISEKYTAVCLQRMADMGLTPKLVESAKE